MLILCVIKTTIKYLYSNKTKSSSYNEVNYNDLLDQIDLIILLVLHYTQSYCCFFRRTLRGDLQVAYHVARLLSSHSKNVNLLGNNHQQVEAIDHWVRFAINDLSNPNKFNSSMEELDSALNSQNFLVQDKLTYADIAAWAELKSMFRFIVFRLYNAENAFTSPGSNDWQTSLENNQTTFNYVRSWYESLKGTPQFQLSF